MSDKRIDDIVANEKEWRLYILKKVDSIDEKQERTREEFIKSRSFLYGAVSILSSVFGFVGAWVHKIGLFK